MFIFKKAIRKDFSSYDARETLRRLESFLDENSPQLVQWLAGVFKNQQNSISYAELEAAALAGFEEQIRQWQEDYARFVNERLTPAWLLAINAGAKQLAEKYGHILDDSNFFVQNWLRNHAGEFITNINNETRQAIRSILYYCQDQQMNPKDIARAIRPTIGLTQQQAAANLRYREHIRQTLLNNHPRMSEARAEEQAQRAALRYSGQQQRYRAESIARTELAFAYNRGAHEGVRQAVGNGLMGVCEKVWETAGSHRTCGRCMELNGKVVGFDDKFFDSKYDTGELPPLHPRCRCVIIYRKVEILNKNPLQINGTSGNIISGSNTMKLTERQRQVKFAENKAFSTITNSDFGFKKVSSSQSWSKEMVLVNTVTNKESVERRLNCQRCAIAHEARMRGYDVIARPSWGNEDPMRITAEWLSVFDYSANQIKKCLGLNFEDVIESAREYMKSFGENSRAVIWFDWDEHKSGQTGGHVIVAECRKNGIVVFGEPTKCL